MAQSIKLGNDVYLAAEGIDGIKAVLTSGDLDDYYGVHKAGVYHLNAGASAFSNAPTGYAVLLCYAGNSSFSGQMVVHGSTIYARERTGNPVAWTHWYRYNGTDTGS